MINHINKSSTFNNIFQTVHINTIEKHLNKSNNSKLLVLNLEDLNADILNHLKEKQCSIFLLNENCTIVQHSKPKPIQLKIDGCRQLIDVEKIVRLEANGSYTFIYLHNHPKPILTSKTLKYHVGLLGEDSFIRSHSKHLINLKYVTSFANGNMINLVSGTSIPVSRRRLNYVKRILKVT